MQSVRTFSWKSRALWSAVLAGAVTAGFVQVAAAATVVYQNDFNAPAGWVDGSGNGTGISFQTVNALFGSAFQQTFTVETIQIAGNGNYSDPSGTGGAYSLGMLAGVENDLLALTFDVGSLAFVNVLMDFAGIGPVACPNCGGPFTVAGQTPIFDLRLYDSPLGSFSLASPGTLLSSATMTGNAIVSTTTLAWNSGSAALSTAGNTDGKVTLVFDLRSGTGLAGYSAFDNLVIASSDQPGDTGGGGGSVPEPSTLLLAGLGAGLLAKRRGSASVRASVSLPA